MAVDQSPVSSASIRRLANSSSSGSGNLESARGEIASAPTPVAAGNDFAAASTCAAVSGSSTSEFASSSSGMP